jgi:plastocyanin
VLLALSTWHKIGLAGVGAIFVVFALASAFLFPRYRPDFPGRRLGTFILVTFVIFIGMLAAVEIFGAEPAEKAEAENEQTVDVKETEFKIQLPSTSLKPGSYAFDLANDGKLPHDLTIEGPGVKKAHTPVINGGQKATLKVKLTAGTYDFYCSVPGHKQLGMDAKVKVV